MHRLSDSVEFDAFIRKEPTALVYFSSPACGVCHALKPRVAALIVEEFPRLPAAEVDCAASPELAAQHQVFSFPTVVVYFDGREAVRKSRSFSLGELAAEIERPYALLFER